jgi:hypothetical protein
MSVDPVLGQVGSSQSWNRYTYVTNNPVNSFDPFGLAEAGDVVFFNWSTQGQYTWPRHAAIVTQVDNNGTPTHAFGAWGDTMEFHEVDLKVYNGGIQDNIIGTGSMKDLKQISVEDLIEIWDETHVAPDWDGNRGLVCVDVVTDPAGLGGGVIREEMAEDLRRHPESYETITLDNGGSKIPNSSSPSFYRTNPWLKQFFINTNRYETGAN